MLVSRLIRSGVKLFASAVVLSLLGGCSAENPDAAGNNEQALTTFSWKGHTWKVTSGGMAGVAQGSSNNVTVDANGYLHLKIVNSGGAWTASELFSADNMGFGTYQWQIDAPIDTFDKQVVLGLFPYGPAAGIGADGTNEIDIEYSRWGNANGTNGDWTDYPASGSTIGELSYNFSLNGGTASTSRFVWNKTSITSSLMSGYQAPSSNAGLIKSWTYAPSNPSVNIPQQALPLGMNLWCFGAPPSNGQNVEVVIRDFQFIAEGSVTQPPPTTGNIAPTGTGYTWSGMTSASANTNRVAKTGVNDGNTSTNVDIVAGDAANAWEAAGVIFGSPQAVTNVSFINGDATTGGDGWLEANAKLQFTTDGTTWTDSGWSISPVYPYTSAAAGNSYGFSGTSANVLGARVIGQVRVAGYSWYWRVKELQITGSSTGSTGSTDSNIAPSGTGYGWSKNTSAGSNANRVASAGINDGNTSAGVNLNVAGENGTAAWEAAGVLFSSAKTLSGAKFVNGAIDSYGNGFLEAGLRLQYTTDGVTWLDLPWSLAPGYPYSSAAGGQTYAFSGSALSGVLGMRVAGQTGGNSWSWIVNEVQLIGH